MYQQLHDPAFLAVASGGTPALDLFFSATKALDSRITFTRGSSATFINSSGLVETAGSGVARFTHNPSTLASLGLLIEESRTNLLLYSEEIDNFNWSKVGATVTQNAGTSPAGSSTAESVTATTTGSALRFVIQSTTKAASAIQYAYSLWFKAVAGGRYVTFTVDDGAGNGFSGGLDLSNGQTTGGVVGGSGTFTSVSATQFPSGWWKVVLLGTSNTSVGLRVAVNLAASLTTGYPSATLTAGDGVLLWGMQLEAGAFATSYIPTTSATVTRAADVATMSGTNFSSWYNATEGTFAVAYLPQQLGVYQQVLQVDNGTGNNRAPSLAHSSTNFARLDWSSGGTTEINILQASGSISLANTLIASSYKIGAGASVATGGTVNASSTAITTPTVDRLVIGNRSATNAYLNAPIARIRYYRRRLPDANLQTLTT